MHQDLLPLAEAAIKEHAMLQVGDSVVVACSGGPDSLALLSILARLRDAYDLTLTAVYVDHRLRPESADEGEFVKEQAERWGIAALVRQVERDLHVSGQSLQALARNERYRLLEQVAEERQAQRIAVGHNADDQMETLMMRVLRGTGIPGLAGIPPVNGRIIRPLLYARRSDIEAYCRRLRLTPIQDPSNSCDDYLRNRIRHHLMPLLHEYNPRLQQALSRLADAARHDNTWLDALTDRFIAEQTFATDGGWWCPMQTFLQQPLAMQRRVVRTLAQRASAAEDAWSVQDLEFGHTQAIIALLRKSVTGTGYPLPSGGIVWVERGGFWIGPQHPQPTFLLNLEVPGEVTLPSGIRVTTRVIAGSSSLFGEFSRACAKSEALPWESKGLRTQLDYRQIRSPLQVRQRLPGDRYQPAGLSGMKKLQDICVDEGIPRRWRDRLPVVTDSHGIIWLPGAKPAQRVSASVNTSVILEIQLQ
ncbi:MAG TPA: tRNA lysidine(34) synthetase TilS [Firmicutes bacterium]|nr:tRNA lysidine(34) synthetase TilS [Bacillota bacterium]